LLSFIFTVTPHQLQTLRAVAETGSIVAASRRLFVTPAAVSSTLSQLAREVGVPLTSRAGRGIVLTPAGEELASRAGRILGELEEALLHARRAAEPGTGLLRLGAVATVGEELLPRWLLAYLDTGADPDVHIAVANKAQLFAALRDHAVDLVISGRPTGSSGLRVVATRIHHLLALASPARASRAFADPSAPTIEELGSITWLLREPGSGTRSSAEELISALGIAPRTLTVGSNLALSRLAELGIGLAILSDETVGRALAEGRLLSLPIGPLPEPRTWCLVARGSELLAPGAMRFLEFLAAMGEIALTPGIAGNGEQVI
jgi:DNA-binding transcriptional LysR family regulator